MQTNNGIKGYYKVEPTRGAAARSQGPWVAMLTSDVTGPQFFYGDERSCRQFIDRKRTEWVCEGMELIQQGRSGLRN